MLDYKKRTIMKRAPINLNIGGTLATGDVVGVCLHNHIDFGWFVEPGESGSLKYIAFRTSESLHIQYDKYLADPIGAAAWIKKKFEDGINYKSFQRDYILSYGAQDNRAFKITDPEAFFKGSATEKIYLEGKDSLNKNKFPAK
jgi:hypothetical protein